MVRFKPLGGMDRLEIYLKAGELPPNTPQIGFDEPIASKQENCWCAVTVGNFGNGRECLCQNFFTSVAPRPRNPDGGLICFSRGHDCLCDLCRVFQDEPPCR